MVISDNVSMARTKSKLQAATVGGTPDDIELTFYEALYAGDIEKLMGFGPDLVGVNNNPLPE